MALTRVGSKGIAPGAVDTNDLSDNTITSAKILGTISIEKGGTGISSPGNTGNILVSNGAAFVSQANPPSSLTNNTRQAVTSAGTTAINLNSGHVVDLTMAASIATLSFTNVPTSGTPVEVKLIIKNDSSGTAYSITWPASIYWDGISSIDSVTGGPTLAIGKNGVTVVSLLTTDGGTKWRGSVQASISGGNAYDAYGWGRNLVGQIGVGSSSRFITEPTRIPDNGNWKKIVTHRRAGAGIKFDGTLWTWGSNQYGNFGDNSYGNYSDRINVPAADTVHLINKKQSTPKQSGFTSTDWSDISAGRAHFHAIKSDGTLWGWGLNDAGQLGNNQLTSNVGQSSPIQIGALTNWAKLGTINRGTGNQTFAIKTDGTMWAWGDNSYGQLGLNNRTNVSSPVQIGALTNWSDFSTDYYHTAAVKTDGTLWAWGQNQSGQLGDNTTTFRSSPVQIGALTNWRQVSVSYKLSFAINTANVLWGWGNGNYVPDNTNINRSSPVQIGALTDWKQVSSGACAFAVKNDGTLWGWGFNYYNGISFPAKYFAPGQNFSGFFSSPIQIGTRTDWDSVRVSPSSRVHAIANKGDVNPS